MGKSVKLSLHFCPLHPLNICWFCESPCVLTCNYFSHEQDSIDARIVVAGLSTTCSQKIHNQLVCNMFSICLMVFGNTLNTDYLFLNLICVHTLFLHLTI
jgi:hypothetical protein